MAIEANDKYAHMVDSLYEKTIDGNLSWIVNPIFQGYITNLNGYTIGIREDGYASQNKDYILTIYDELASVVDYFSDVTLADYVTGIAEFPDYYSLMGQLFKKAGRDASGADRVLGNLLLSLGVDVETAPSKKRKADSF